MNFNHFIYLNCFCHETDLNKEHFKYFEINSSPYIPYISLSNAGTRICRTSLMSGKFSTGEIIVILCPLSTSACTYGITTRYGVLKVYVNMANMFADSTKRIHKTNDNNTTTICATLMLLYARSLRYPMAN